MVQLCEAPSLQQQETGGVQDVRRTFGFTETFTYNLWYKGKIKSALIPGRGKKRGKRIFDFASIREYIAECQQKAQK
jgi:hypothetical protein